MDKLFLTSLECVGKVEEDEEKEEEERCEDRGDGKCDAHGQLCHEIAGGDRCQQVGMVDENLLYRLSIHPLAPTKLVLLRGGAGGTFTTRHKTRVVVKSLGPTF